MAQYEYLDRLGGGGMAEVFLARVVGTEGFQRPIAIKRVLPSFSQDAQFATMFINEARLSAMLRHPNIVQVLDFDRDDERRLFLVMELIEGKDLDALAKSAGGAPLPVAVVVHVIAEVLEGLAHAHEMTTPEGRPLGIVHRDISPHNVLLSWDGAVKVSDFGIAKAMLASGAASSGMIKGKPLYMAPEQVTTPDTVDQRADLFAVGVMAYELLTGKRVYQGHSNEEVLTDVIQVARGWRQLAAPNVLRPDLPWDVCQVVMMLLAPDRNQRFASARDAHDALLRTTSASARGTSMVAELMAQRFPDEVPRRRMSPQQRAAAATVRPAQMQLLDSGERKRQLQVETRTIEPVPAGAAATAPMRGPKKEPTKSYGRLVLILALSAVAAAVAAAVTIMLTEGGGAKESAAAPDAAAAAAPAPVPAPDAAPARVPVPDAARVPVPDAAPVPIDAAPPPDASKRSGRGRGRGTGKGTDAAVRDDDDDTCDYDGDGVPDCR
jgi:eukaryotic-like serine/threonine-protein kinase